MNPNLIGIGAPPSLDAPRPAPAPASDPNEPQGDPSQAHYRGPEARCYSCEYFQEPSSCSKGVNGGTVEPEGGCDLFEASDSDGDEGGDVGSEPQGAMA